MSAKYLNTWLKDLHNFPNRPLTMVPKETFSKKFYATEESREAKELEILKKDYGFVYRNGIIELIYAMVTCRPDLSLQSNVHNIRTNLHQYTLMPLGTPLNTYI
jgi:hypothetical protein